MQSSLRCLLAAGYAAAALADKSVFTYGPASNYHKAPATTASPTGNDLLITPTDVGSGIPAKGIDFFFGPDLQASVQETLDGVCAKELSEQCIDELSSALNRAEQYTIESRVVGAATLLGAAAVAIVGLGIKLFDEPQPELVHFHLESTDVAQLQSITGDTATLATATEASNYITVTVAPTTTRAVEPATVTTLSVGDTNGHQQGDILIALPSQPADLLEQLLRKSGAPDSCRPQSQGTVKRVGGAGPDYVQMNRMIQFILPMAAPGELLHGLGLQPSSHLPLLKDTIAQASLDSAQAAAAAIEQFKDVAVGLRDLIAETVWVAAYDMCMYEQIELSTLVLEDQLITDDPVGDDDEDLGCTSDPLERPICDTVQCAGVAGVCQEGDDKDCKCLSSTPYYVHPGDASFVQKAYIVLSEMVELDRPAELHCGTQQDQGNADYFFTLDAMNAAADDFCKRRIASPFIWPPKDPNADPSEQLTIKEVFVEDGDNRIVAAMNYKYTAYPYGIYGINGNTVDANSTCPTLDMGSADALQMCKDRLGKVINDCNTSNPKNAERWKQGGSLDEDCVHWYIGR